MNRPRFAVLVAAGAIALSVTVLNARRALHRGVLYYDEAYYLLETKALSDGLHNVPALMRHQVSVGELKTRIREAGGIFPPGTAKPTFAAYLTLSTLCPLPLDQTACLAILLAGCLCALAIYRLGVAIGLNPETSAWSAFFLLTSSLWGYYAVSALPHVLAALFFCMAIWIYLSGAFACAGLLLGLSLSTHYGMLPQVGLFFFWAAADVRFFQKDKGAGARRFAAMVLCFLAPLLVWQIGFVVAKRIFGAHLGDVAYLTYFEQIHRQVGRASTLASKNYLATVWRNAAILAASLGAQGIPLSVYLAGGILCALSRFRSLSRTQACFLAFALASAAFWLLNPGTVVTRVTILFLPLFILSAGFGWETLLSRTPNALPRLILLVVMIFSARSTLEMDRMLRSPIPAAAAELSAAHYDGTVVDPQNWPLWQFYLGRRMDFRPENMKPLAHVKAELFGTPQNRAHRVLFAFAGNEVVGYPEGSLPGFYKKLFARPPSAVLKTPYTRLRLFEGDESEPRAPGSELPFLLYWVSDSDFKDAYMLN